MATGPAFTSPSEFFFFYEPHMLTNILCFHDIVVQRMYFFLAVSSSSLYLTDMKDDVFKKFKARVKMGEKGGFK